MVVMVVMALTALTRTRTPLSENSKTKTPPRAGGVALSTSFSLESGEARARYAAAVSSRFFGGWANRSPNLRSSVICSVFNSG
jgi:hypothetical protein